MNDGKCGHPTKAPFVCYSCRRALNLDFFSKMPLLLKEEADWLNRIWVDRTLSTSPRPSALPELLPIKKETSGRKTFLQKNMYYNKQRSSWCVTLGHRYTNYTWDFSTKREAQREVKELRARVKLI